MVTYYRAEIRGTATKIPGFIYFSGRNTAVFNIEALISIDDYSAFMNDIYDSCSYCK